MSTVPVPDNSAFDSAGLCFANSSSFEPGTQHDPQRVLFISYAFPPTGGGGVQRSVKFTRYLPEFGWLPTVLTVRNPSVPVQDHNLATQVDSEMPILRATTFEPGYGVKKAVSSQGHHAASSWRGSVRKLAMQLLQPDPQILWNPRALALASAHLRRIPHAAIVVTGPPFSSFLLGHKLKRRFNLPLILDFRDEWLLSMANLDNYRISGLGQRLQHWMLLKVLRSADGVIATTEGSANHLHQQCLQAGSNACVKRIYNGFDPPDLPKTAVQTRSKGRLRIVYTGTLWKLTDIQPLINAILRLEATAATITGLELVLVGRRTPAQQDKLQQLQRSLLHLKCVDYVDHNRSLELADEGDLLLLLLSDDDGAERVVPAKLFEYLALNKPILAICPDGETADLLRRFGQQAVFRPQQTEQIATWLQSRLNSERNVMERSASLDGMDQHRCSGELRQFERSQLTGQLAAMLQRVTQHSDQPR